MPDPASLATILALSADISSLATGLNQAIQLVSGFGAAVVSTMKSVVEVAERGMQALQNLAGQVVKMSQTASSFNIMKESFKRMTASIGVSSDKLLASMNAATMGMVSNADLIQSSMTAMMLINERAIGDAAETIPMLAKIATAAARALGEDVSFMFDSIARGIGRASPMILDNLGFAIRLGEVYGRAADALGVTAKELDSVQRQTALLNEVMRMGEGYISNLGLSSDNLTAATAQLHKTIEDLRTEIGTAFAPLVRSMTMFLGEAASAIRDRVVPAFRMLSRVIAEVVGMPNPFAAIAGGQYVEAALERIENIRANIEWLKEAGPDFQSGITEAIQKYEDAAAELDDTKFAARRAGIQNKLTDTIADIWANFTRRQERDLEDRHLEQERAEEDHLERMGELSDRYANDITDAIRKRDARQLIDLIKRQKQELTAETEQYTESEQRRDEDFAKRQARAREDAALREQEAKESAAKEAAALEVEFQSAIDKLAATRDAAISAAKASWEAELAYLENSLEKQHVLLEEERENMLTIQAELAKPIPPFFQRLGEVLGWVYDKLVMVKDLAITLITGEGDLPGWFGDVADAADRFKDAIDFDTILADMRGAWNDLKPVLDGLKETLGPEFTEGFKEIGEALKTITPLIPQLGATLSALAPILAVPIAGALVIATGLFRALARGVANAIETVTSFIDGLLKFAEGVGDTITGAIQTIKGIFTGNRRDFEVGLQKFLDGIKNMFVGSFGAFVALSKGFYKIFLEPFGVFVKTIWDIVSGFFDDLIGNSLIPDNLGLISTTVSGFFGTVQTIWDNGWGALKATVTTTWNTITETVGASIDTAIGRVQGWWASIKNIGKSIGDLVTQSTSRMSKQSFGSRSGTNAGTVNMTGWNFYRSQNSVRDTQTQFYSMLEDAAGAAGDFMAAWRRR